MMSLSGRQLLTILALGLIGWALCGAIMFVGISVTSLETALVVHAVAAPVIFSTLSWWYFTKLKYTAPLTTAVTFTLTVILMDFFLVALVINRTMDMFRSLLGTWIPFGLIFLTTYLTGLILEARTERPRTA